MHTLILGASGFLGSHLFQRCKSEVTGTCRTRSNHAELIPIDATEASAISALIRDIAPSVIIWSLMDGTREPHLIANGLSALLREITSDTRLIYLSTDGVFTGERGGYKEDDPTVYLPEQNPLAAYTNAKLNGEKMIRRTHPNHVIIRTGPLYGKGTDGRWDKRTADMINRLASRTPFPRAGNLYKTFVRVEDLAEAVLALKTTRFTGTLHVGPSRKESYYSFHKKMATALDLDHTLIRETVLSPEEARQKGIPLDTSLNTEKCRQLLKTPFRNL
ncbi:MAG: sugar nucleotide-binding protein [Bacillaceae bacterium]|nr:sugar nucleotide-binding protein [Bacillaceae bacterium]